MHCTRFSGFRLFGLAALLVIGGACVDARESDLPLAEASDSQTCFDCHGARENGNAAPPPAIWQGTGVLDAHQAHLQPGDTHAAIACETCHEVPSRVLEDGHIDSDLPAEVVFAGLALANGALPEVVDGTCENTWCHGAALVNGAGTLTNPPWSLAGGNPVECGSCHGLPPGPPHPPAEDCERCHGAVVDAEGFVRPELHVNGTVELSIELACDSCHGDGGNPAPPPDTTGDLETTARGVGAHESHLAQAAWHDPVECGDCHRVPEEIQDEGHIDSALPAEVLFAGLSVTDDAAPVWDVEAETCAGTYCHGATLGDPAALLTEPVWTVVDESQAECGTCHGLPPGGGHPPRSDCESCHSQVVSADTFIDPGLHIDGQVQLDDLGCDGCHGGGGDPAPPADTRGNVDTEVAGVGAHQAHLGVSDWHAEIACAECHSVPEDLADEGHIDTPLPAEILFGELAAVGDGDPAYVYDDNTCAGTWCHGDAMEPESAGTLTVPDWTVVDGSQAACGTCHGLPPGGDHPTRSDCATCHGEVIAADGSFADPALHIDGEVQLAELQCDSCHGQAGNPAPPLDTRGRRSVQLPTIGAHRAHLGEATWHAEIQCAECHDVPEDIDDPGHLDDTPGAELIWGALATDEDAEPVYDEDTFTCADTYCHGSTLSPGGTLRTPTWTAVNEGQAACGTCHALPPGGSHPDRTDCATCHGPVISENMLIIRPDLHINGQADIE